MEAVCEHITSNSGTKSKEPNHSKTEIKHLGVTRVIELSDRPGDGWSPQVGWSLRTFRQSLTPAAWSSNNTENTFTLPSPRPTEFLQRRTQVFKIKFIITLFLAQVDT